MAVTSIRLNSDIEKPLEALAKKLDRSKNYVINQAIKDFVSRNEMEEARWADTLQALDSVKAGKTIDEAEVTSWLESWGTEDEKSPPTI
ncbi:MAG: transcriptional regulator [SAR86 cluster bacterium]|uniref:Transcriptional regulator n=1 Tax=SAR86 cluster bacterium TaxID=2030880 RepID=A0A2A5C7T6_9GAMM|nr:MAG: transcriptional regulator [SAR86 cluster bacterium]